MFDYNTMRYVHLDFHTPGFVRVGEKFDPVEFADTLDKAKVNAIAVFALCHHGYAYYPSKIATPHPGMQIDLLGGMTEELKKRDIQCIVYFSQNVNEVLSTARPECVALRADGSPVDSQILLSGHELYWRWLCPNRGDWIDSYLLPLIRETLANYHADGIFIDMAGYLPGSCYCEACRAKMQAAGLEINDPDQHDDFMVETNQELAGRLRTLLDEIKPGLRLLNGCFNRLGDARLAKGVLSEFYLETLPAQVGWFLFPFLARYFRNFDLPVMGCTGRFLNNWGDFGTVKTAHQLKVEVATHMAAGLPTGVGDHMHFNGQLNKAVYKVIGNAFSFLEERQPYCVGGKAVTEVIVPFPKRLSVHAAMISKEQQNAFSPMTAITGLTKMLTETHFQWDISHENTDLSKAGAVILNHNTCELESVEKLERFVDDGGLLIACHEGMKAKTPEATRKLQVLLGIKSLEMLEDPGVYYETTVPELTENMPPMPVYTHTRSYKMELAPDVKQLAALILPPCARSREHFYGHFHGAPDKSAGTAIGIRQQGNGYAVVIGPSLFFSYMTTGHAHHLTLIRNILETYFPTEKRRVKTNAPGIVELALSEKDGDLVLQAVPFVASRRHSESFETLNDVVPIHGMRVSVKAPFKVSGVFDPVAKESIEFTAENGWITFQLPPVAEHFVGLIKRQ